jgi:asparagine synthase (glutamine-hydrolysing)
MTIFAGVYARNPNSVVPQSAIDEIRARASRSTGHRRREFSSSRLFVSVIDMGAFPVSGVVDNRQGGTFTAIVGDSILKRNGNRRFSDRARDADALARELATDHRAALSQSCGTFAGVHFETRANTLKLFTDKVGVRPVYIATTNEFVAFATSLRLLEELSIAPKRLDVTGLVEHVALHWPMGRRTPYRDISVLGPAEVCTCDGADLTYERYWDWPTKTSSGLSQDEHLTACHETFLSAIEARQTNSDRSELAFLSGGLDSRSIVAGLRQRGASVTSINFAPPRSQDQVFARDFADRIGTRHMEVPIQRIEQSENDMVAVAEYLNSQTPELGSGVNGRLIWSGNGGSVGLGHVYMTKAIVSRLREGRISDAIDEYMRGNGQAVTRRPLTPDLFRKYRDAPKRALEQELARIQTDDPARAFYVLLMNNDQHRSLHWVYEHIDLHGIEFVLPFFDSDFLAAVFRVPIDVCLYHDFYNRWLKRFPEATANTPWQSYPGHVPCPINSPSNLGYQFDESFSREWGDMLHRQRVLRGRAMLASDHFPSRVLSRQAIRLATVVSRLGSQRFDYVLDKGFQYFRYAEKASFE